MMDISLLLLNQYYHQSIPFDHAAHLARQPPHMPGIGRPAPRLLGLYQL